MFEAGKTTELNGVWDFYYDPHPFLPGSTALPEKALFTGRMAVPGYWDDHYDLFDEEDFFSLHARFNPDYRKVHFPMGHTQLPHASSSFLIGSGYYRRNLAVRFPEGAHAVLHVGPAMWGCSVYCNRKPAGVQTGYSTGTDFDLTGLLRSGEENELLIVVCNVRDDGGAYCRLDGSHDGEDFGTRAGQHRGLAAQGYQAERAGICEGVTLRLTGSGVIADCFTYADAGCPRWKAELRNGTGKTLAWRVSDGERILDSGSFACCSDEADFRTAPLPELWSDRTPRLYDFTLELFDGETLSDRRTWKWGFRHAVCDGLRILLNGKPTYFRGVTEHCYFPETCNPHSDKGKYLHDLGMLRKAGFNFIRCHTWCPPEAFYEACDELGFLVQTEQPSVYSPAETESILRMIRRHACAVIFCEGNEKKISDRVFERLRQVASMVRRLAPGMLFNPQEAMRGVEYDFIEGRNIERNPIPHDAERLAQIAEFSDLYGSLSGGYFSYLHDVFPGVAEVERQHSFYRKPCLSHEIGILGGYLNFELEARYEGTFIGQDLFRAVREHLRKNNVYQYADLYYRNNCRFIASLRKQLMENIRSCPSITGYDFLGGIDTHWHFCGYPCGVLNEFYEKKYGETLRDVLRYNGESVLLCGASNRRNRFAGTEFREKLLISCFGAEPEADGELFWSFASDDGNVIAEGRRSFSGIPAGTVRELEEIAFPLPESARPYSGVLRASAECGGTVLENCWTFWVFPRKEVLPGNRVRCAETLTDEVIGFAEDGGSVLLRGGFPAGTRTETFRPHTSGRTLGHAGILIHEHPVLRDFPHEGFGDWQFFPMMSGAVSMIHDSGMPEFHPVIELIPSFKLVRRKSMLSEFRVGKGRILMCGLALSDSDPAGRYLRGALLEYLNRGVWEEAPEWESASLRERIRRDHGERFQEIRLDEGGRIREKRQ